MHVNQGGAMETGVSRRTVLRGTLAVGAAAALLTEAGAPAYAAPVADQGVSAFGFPLSAVTLLAGPFLDNMNRTLAYLNFVDADRLLHTFRLNVGITSTATPCGGWEGPAVE